jgi:hypothetical protein
LRNRTVNDLVCHLIRHGYGSEKEIRSMSFHDVLMRVKWFSEWDKKNSVQCPLLNMGSNTKKSNKFFKKPLK